MIASSAIKFDGIGEYVEIFLDKPEGLIRVDAPRLKNGYFTLSDVYNKYESFKGLIYVFTDGGLRGKIYRCNNYSKGIWQEYAKTEGYA